MRHEKAARLLELARRLAGSAEGLTLDEMAAAMGVGRRTAERMRDAVRDDARLRDASARWAEWDSLWDEAAYCSEPEARQAFAA